MGKLNEREYSAHHLPMDLALARWSVVCESWGELAGGHAPYLPAFLAGWYTRQIGVEMPDDLGTFKDSYRVGWREADQEVAIDSR